MGAPTRFSSLIASINSSASVYSTLSPTMPFVPRKSILPTGSGALLLEGTVRVTHAGAVVDITAGGEVASGQTLKENHRYLVGEDTSAVFTVYNFSGGEISGAWFRHGFGRAASAEELWSGAAVYAENGAVCGRLAAGEAAVVKVLPDDGRR